MKNEELTTQVSALDIKQGTVVVLRLGSDTPVSAARTMGEELQKLVPFGNLILVLPNGENIETLDEAQMRELGWVRQSAVDEVVSALESLILFTKPSKSNAVALNNAHAVIASAKGGV